jgi:magnesium transporter
LGQENGSKGQESVKFDVKIPQMIRTLYFTPGRELRTDLKIDEFKAALENAKGLLWVDFEATSPETDEPILREIFGFHPLAIDDALKQSHIPRVDDWSEYLYIVLHALAYDPKDEDRLDTLELDIFLGRNYLVTHHDDSIYAIERMWEICQRDERHLRHGADHFLYRLTDEVITDYMTVVEELDEAIEKAEDQVLIRPTNATLEQILSLKRGAVHMLRILGPQREVANKLARDDYRVIDAEARVYFRDVYDHLVRLHDITESIRDLVSGALDTYLSVINNRMNDIMRTLTIITTLFMPISFVVGFFGMNFFGPTYPFEDWTGLPVFLVTLGVLMILPALMFVWIRRRGWLK